MNINQAFPSKYLKAADFNDRPFVVTVSHVDMEVLDTKTGESKPVVYFERSKKGLVLNIINGKKIAEMYGQETDDWIGQDIELFPTTTEFQGETVPCIRVRPPRGEAPTAPEPEQAAIPVEKSKTDDDLPF